MNDQAEPLRKKFSKNNTPPPRRDVGHIRSLSFTSGKGGVGKTNIVVNLSMHFAQMGKKVFIVDADLGLANIDIMLNIAPEYTIEDVLIGKKQINEIIVEGPLGIHVLPSSSGISEMQSLSGQQQMSILKALGQLQNQYDYILIDTGAGIAPNVLRFNAAVDDICVVTNTEPTSLTDAYALMKLMNSKYQVHDFNLIVNQASLQQASAVHQRLVNVLDQYLSVQLNLIGNVPRDINFVKAVKQQTPLSLLFPNSTSSKSLRKIAQKIDQRSGQASVEKTSSFWNRFGSWKRKK